MDISSRIFHQYRVIGNFCCEKGFCMENVGSNNFVTTSIGNAFHTYDVKKLNLIAASDPVVETIHMLSSTENGEILCAHGTKLSVWKRGKMIGEPWIHESNISRIYAIGNVVACYEESGELNVYHVPERRLISSIQFSGEFEITAWCHPPTYINKIVIGFKSGHLQIWNIITCQMVQSLTKFEGQTTCIKESPILDIIAVGVGSLLYIFNCKKNENIFLFKSDIEIAFISFRNTKDDVYHLAFCGVQSDILILDIEKNQLVCSIPAHTKNISGINYVNCQPLLVTASGDNSIKIWIFDHMDGSARLLKSRSGIPDSISKLRFIPGPRGLNLLSASGSFLRFTNCNRDEQSFDFSYGRPRKDWKDKSSESRPFYLPPISDFDVDTTKEYFFDNIVTCHQKTNWVQAWRLDKKKISKLKLKHSLLQNQIPTCVKITACGNNCMVGYNHGSLELFNLESGAHRASFVDTGRKSSAIVGVAVDGRNILCASIDKSHLRIWFFKNHSLKTRVKLLFSPKKIEINRQNSMVAVVGDHKIVVVDILNSQTIRNFDLDDALTDFCLSEDGRWLICCSGEYIKVWDLPSSKLIDEFKTEKQINSISLSQNKSILAIAHDSNNSITLLINRTLYNPTILLPISGATENKNEENMLCEGLTTLSLLPDSRWRYLDKIDLIKLRSQPSEPVKKIESAPFFLPTTTELNPTFEIEETAPEKRRKVKKKASSVTLVKHLAKYSSSKRQEFLCVLMNYSPFELDVQLEFLADSDENIEQFLDIMKDLISTYENFEFVQGILALFLKIHGQRLVDSKHRNQLETIRELIKDKCEDLRDMAGQSLSVVGFLRSRATFL